MSGRAVYPRKALATAKVASTPSFFSQGVLVGDSIYVSGQVGMDREGAVVGKGDMTAQTRAAIENIKAILEEAGATLDDVVKLTMFITDMSQAPLARAVRTEYFSKFPPASTGVQVSALAHPDLLVEIDAVAVRDPRSAIVTGRSTNQRKVPHVARHPS